jgi:hypothetical protein
MSTRLDSRPINIDISNYTLQSNGSITLNYNLEKIDNLYLSKYDNPLIKIKGIKCNSPSTNKYVLLFNNTTYIFDKIIITNDFDKITKTDESFDAYNIAIMLSFIETSGNRTLYITFPLKKGNGSTDDSQEFINSLLNEISVINQNNTSSINLTEEFDLNDLFNYTGFNNNEYIYYSYTGSSLFIITYLENSQLYDNNFIFSDYSSIFSNTTPETSFNTSTIPLYIMTNLPEKVSTIMNDNNLSDIYIDCSPISSDASYQIIEPKKLKLQSTLFSDAEKLITDNTFLKILTAIFFLISLGYLFYNIFKMPLSILINLINITNIKENIKNIKINNSQDTILTLLTWLVYISFFMFLFTMIIMSIVTESGIKDNAYQGIQATMWIIFIFTMFMSMVLIYLKVILFNENDKNKTSKLTFYYTIIFILIGFIAMVVTFSTKWYLDWWKIMAKDSYGDRTNETLFIFMFFAFLIVFNIIIIYIYKSDTLDNLVVRIINKFES